MDLVNATLIRNEREQITKGGGKKHTFGVNAYEFTIIANITDVGLFEQAVIEGIGCTRVFGFGMMRAGGAAMTFAQNMSLVGLKLGRYRLNMLRL